MWLSTSCRTSCRAKCPERVQRPEEGSGQEDETVLRDSFILGDVFGMSASLSLLQNSTHFLQAPMEVNSAPIASQLFPSQEPCP